MASQRRELFPDSAIHAICAYGAMVPCGNKRAKRSRVIKGGYVIVLHPGHPIAVRNYIAEHRKVLYDAMGPGPHPCHWCGVMLEWKDINVDHLNEQKAQNTLDNLVVSCVPCNRTRGGMLPFLQRMRPEAFEDFVRLARAQCNGYQCVKYEGGIRQCAEDSMTKAFVLGATSPVTLIVMVLEPVRPHHAHANAEAFNVFKLSCWWNERMVSFSLGLFNLYVDIQFSKFKAITPIESRG